MEERQTLVILYDYYGELLSNISRSYFEDYYFDNLSLGEIAENNGVSRNAVHKHLKNAAKKLLDYESKLKLYEKGKKLSQIISKVNDKNVKKALEELNN